MSASVAQFFDGTALAPFNKTEWILEILGSEKKIEIYNVYLQGLKFCYLIKYDKEIKWYTGRDGFLIPLREY